MASTARRRALECLGEADYNLVEAVRIYQDRHGPIVHFEGVAIAELWAQLDREARIHMSGDGPSAHGYGRAVRRMSYRECLELHVAEHRGSEPPMHGHEMEPIKGGLRPPGWPAA
jgi:hypothetical protein